MTPYPDFPDLSGSIVDGDTLSGTVTWTVTYNGAHSPLQNSIFFLDGEELLNKASPLLTMSLDIDTTLYADGPHLLGLASIYVITVPRRGEQLAGHAIVSVTFANGAVDRIVRPHLAEAKFKPSELWPATSDMLSCDGSRSPTAARSFLVPGNPVSADFILAAPTPSDQLLGGSKGCRVSVKPRGPIKTLYPGRIIAAMFANPITVPTMDLNALKAAGFSAISTSVYVNPADSGVFAPPTFEAWKVGYDNNFAVRYNYVRDSGLLWLGLGDVVARTVPERNNSETGPYSTQSLQYMMTKLHDTGICAGIEMVDEAGVLIGHRPPSAIYTIVDKMRGVLGPPIAWPCDCQAPTSANDIALQITIPAWNNSAVSDYGSAYPLAADPYGGVPGRTWSLPQFRVAVDRAACILPVDRPRSLLVPFTGGSYSTYSGSGFYDPDHGDLLITGPHTPRLIQMAIWQAIAREASVLRFYDYDVPAWAAIRMETDGRTAPMGTSPTVGPERWAAASNSLNWLKIVEPWIVGTPENAPDWGPDWIVAVRSGPAGNLLWAINALESDSVIPATAPVTANAAILTIENGLQVVSPASVPNTPLNPGGVVFMWDNGGPPLS